MSLSTEEIQNIIVARLRQTTYGEIELHRLYLFVRDQTSCSRGEFDLALTRLEDVGRVHCLTQETIVTLQED